jgi:hypothetical protein
MQAKPLLAVAGCELKFYRSTPIHLRQLTKDVRRNLYLAALVTQQRRMSDANDGSNAL